MALERGRVILEKREKTMTRNIRWIVSGLIVGLLSQSVSVTQAQYLSEREQEKQNEAKTNAKLIAALDAVRGKTFWYRPNLKAYLRVEFFEPDAGGGAPQSILAEKFVVTMETNFVVVDYKLGAHGDYYLKLEFPDGKIGYIVVYSGARYQPDRYPLIQHLYLGKKPIYDFEEYIFPRPPKEMFAASKANQAKAAAESKARGGVRIGMTSAQVLKSNWGKPSKINRTTTPYGTHEQWVYGDHNYLYFEKGILTSVQN